MVHITSGEDKRFKRLAKEEHKIEEKKRKNENRELFLQWQKENPTKGFIDYIL